MPQYLVHEVDFSKFMPAAVYRYGQTLANRGDLANVQSASFHAGLKKGFQQHQSEDEHYTLPDSMCKNMTI